MKARDRRTGTRTPLGEIPSVAVRRLSLYLRQLEVFQQSLRRTVSSHQLGSALGITDAQVRKDLAYFGQFGSPGLGYSVDDLIAHIRRILGTDKDWNVAVIGAGNLGRALLQYKGFARKGFHVVAAFDTDPARTGKSIAGVPVYPMDELARVVAAKTIRLAILAVPAEAAQGVYDRLTAVGVMGAMNFAPVPILTSPRLALNTVDLAVQLEQLSFQVNLKLG